MRGVPTLRLRTDKAMIEEEANDDVGGKAGLVDLPSSPLGGPS